MHLDAYHVLLKDLISYQYYHEQKDIYLKNP